LAKAVVRFLKEMSQLFGPNILRGRVEICENGKYIGDFDKMGICADNF
jgi:hypothetical protein